MAVLQTLVRVFKLGSAIIPDPCPGSDLQTAVQVLSVNYPQFRWASLFESDGRIVDDQLQYELVLPPPKTNG